MPRGSLSRITVLAIGALLTLFCPMMVQAQSVKIVLPERFRVLSDQLFDLRVEVTGLSSLSAQIQLTVSGNKHDGLQGIGLPEVTTNNDNNPADLDKAWTWRRLSFGREGLRTLKAVITDGANTYEASTQI